MGTCLAQRGMRKMPNRFSRDAGPLFMFMNLHTDVWKGICMIVKMIQRPYFGSVTGGTTYWMLPVRVRCLLYEADSKVKMCN